MKYNSNRISSPFALGTRSYKAIVMLAIWFVASFLMIVLSVESGYSAQSCPNLQPTIRIIDESGWRFPDPSPNKLESSPFKDYVTEVSERLSTKVCEMAANVKSANNSPEVELFFVYRPLIVSSKVPYQNPFGLDLNQMSASRYLDSPWAKIIVSQSPKLLVRAAFILNERQYFLDQALISGERVIPEFPLVPISEREFKNYKNDFKRSVIYARTPEIESNALDKIVTRLSPDILWLFRRSDRGRRNYRGDLILPLGREKLFDDYLSINFHGLPIVIPLQNKEPIKALIDRFFGSSEPILLYRSVLELDGIFPLSPKFNHNK